MPEHAARVVSYRTTAGGGEEYLMGEILLHISLHASNDLAQVATLLTLAGVEPSPVDHIAWVWARRP
jgi:uncharacterized damage-inducible protein DinB